MTFSYCVMMMTQSWGRVGRHETWGEQVAAKNE